jgi:peptide-methionine (R)-S-oxide reductase
MITWREVEQFAKHGNPPPDQKVVKTESEWKKQLAEDVFSITRLAGTEKPFSSAMCTLFEPGKYACSCCDTLLFDASEKFDSKTGWPSFTQPIQPNAVAYFEDNSYGMHRIEVTCNSCDGHLGHVFPDGPEPSNLRYCVNALSIKKIA